MTRARAASYGVGTPPPLDRWIDAVLMLFVSLVQGLATTFGMGTWIRARDWHTHSDSSALPQTKPDIHIKEEDLLPQSRTALRQAPLLDHAKGQAIAPSEDHTRKSRNFGTEPLEACEARVPGKGRGPASTPRALLQCTVIAVIPSGARPARIRNDGTRASKPSLT
jgi:hypothetical protein